MEGTRDAFPYVLAEALGMTLAELGQMSSAEYIEWQAFYTYRTAMAELEAKRQRGRRR